MNRLKALRPEDLYRQTAFLITDVARRYRTTFDDRITDLKLHRSEWMLIRHLHFFEGSTQAELSEVMDITKGGMGKLIDRLEKDGLVRRTADGNDRRTNRVFLTARTKALAAELHQHSKEIESEALSPLDRDEIATLNRLLERMRQRFIDQEIDGTASEPQLAKKLAGRSTAVSSPRRASSR